VAYRAEIEIAVKGASQLSSFQGKLDSTALAVDQLNKFLKNFSDNAEGISRSVSNLNRQLGKAAQSFNDVALGTEEATVAAVDYLTATRNLNAGLRERAQLLAEVAENERKARLASAGIRERTQFPGPIGPGAASSTALFSPLPARSARTTQYLSPIFPGAASTFGTDQSLVGQSSAVGGRVARLRAVQEDDIKLQEALLALNRKTAQEKNKQVDAQEALVRGANEVKALAAEARGETISSNITGKKSTRRAEELADKRFEKQNRTRRAEDIAKEAALKSKANQEEFAALKKYQDELFNIERSFIRKLRNEKIDAVLEAAKIEGEKQDELLQRIKRNNKEGLDDFDRRLKASGDTRKARSQALTLTGQSSPVGGAVNIPGSPAARARTARNRRLRDAGSNAIIGGAFPLLFGQGAGASLGGAAGGALGGLAGGQFGFGLSLVGTAVGAAVDGIIKNAEDLGKALNGLDGNFAAVLEATGDAENGFGALVNEIAQVIGKEKALEVATQRLAVIVGDEGVNALKEFGNDTSNLGNELTKAFTAVSASIANFINKLGVLDATANRINFVRLTQKEASTPEIKKLQEERDSFDKGIIFGGSTAKVRELNEQIAVLQRIAEEEENINVIKAAQLELQQTINRKTSSSIEIKKQEITIAENGGDLLNAQVVAALENVAAEKVRLKILEAQGDPLKVNLALLEGQLDFVSRINRIEAARKRKEEQAARDAETARRKAEREEARRQKEIERAAKERLRLESGLLNINLQKTFESLKQIQIQKGSKASLSTELASIQSILQNRVEIVQKSGEDITLQKERIELLEAQAFTRKIEIEQQLKQIQNEKELIKLQNQRALEGTRTGLEQELAGLSILESPDDALRREQSDRYANTLAAINNEIEEQNLLISQTPSPNQEIISAAQSRIEFLNKESNIYKELLPQIAQAEQAQLQFNKAFEAVSPAVNSLVGGLQEVVAGTKSAEEAFADFLNTIADQLIQTAATLIAQYIAIGLAKAFAGLSGSGGGGLNFDTSAPSITGNTLGDFGGGTPFAGAFRADGGPVSANRPYIVGERGPELLIPQTSGTVLSNEDSRAALAKYSPGNNLLSEAGDSTGTVAGRNETLNPVINISTGPTLQFEGEGYVKQEDFKAGLARAAQEGAKQGQTLTLRKLMMSPTARSKIGI